MKQVQRRSDVHSTPDLWDIVRQSEMPDEGLGEPLWSAEASSAMVDHDEQEELPDDVLQILCSEHVERQKLINDIKSSPREYIHQFQWSPVWKKLLGVDGGNRGGRSILRGTKRAAGRSFTNSRGGRGRIR